MQDINDEEEAVVLEEYNRKRDEVAAMYRKMFNSIQSMELNIMSSDNSGDITSIKYHVQKYKESQNDEFIEDDESGSYTGVTLDDGTEIFYDCGNYIVEADSVSLKTKKGKQIICNFPVFPVRRYLNKKTHLEMIELLYKRDGEFRYQVAPATEIRSGKLDDYGIPCRPGCSTLFADFLWYTYDTPCCCPSI